MPIVPGPDNRAHLTTFEDASVALCGEALCGADMVNPAVAVPVTCQECRTENGRRIRARIEEN